MIFFGLYKGSHNDTGLATTEINKISFLLESENHLSKIVLSEWLINTSDWTAFAPGNILY